MDCLDASWRFACPRCREELTAVSPTHLICPHDQLDFQQQNGIWRMLLPERSSYFQQFISEYETVRRHEGWGSADKEYYRALPQVKPDDAFRQIWHIRARSFQALREQVIRPSDKGLHVLDLGAGNGWLSYRLRQLGHCPAAIDLLLNEVDGLGAQKYYDEVFTAVQAEFIHLPLTEAQADVVIFNGSFHYAADYEQTLWEVKRVLRPNGRVIIMDSPIYHNPASGQQMVQERAHTFAQKHGFCGEAVPHENYLTFTRLAQLTAAFSIQWQMIQPAYGWRWAIRPWLARLRGHREPATFRLIVGTFL